MPKNWEFKRFKTKHWHDYACCKCGAREAQRTVLHAHHIIFRSNSGTNSYRNLVTLCYACHQAEHDHPIHATGGEPVGMNDDESVEELDAILVDSDTIVLPTEFNEWAYSQARPTFEIAYDAFRADGKSAREFFVFLVQTFGRAVGRYALKFADEKRAANR